MTTEQAQRASIREPVRTVVSLIVILAWLAFGVSTSYRAIASHTWPTVNGTIISAVETTRSAGKGFKHGVELAYSYTVGWNEHRAHFFKVIDAVRGTPAWADAIARYQANAAFTVHYNPEDPGDHVIEPGLSFFHVLMTGLPLLFLAVIVSVTVRQMKEIKRNHAR